MDLPLKDGQEFIDSRGRRQIVGGSIRKNFFSNEYNHAYCWTRGGDWFRRSDALEVTGAYFDEDGNPVSVSETYKIRNKTLYSGYDRANKISRRQNN